MWKDSAGNTVKPPKLTYKTAEQVVALRKKHGLNQTEFWSKIAITQSGGSRYESGRGMPKTVQLLLQLAYGTPKESDSLLSAIRVTESKGRVVQLEIKANQP